MEWVGMHGMAFVQCDCVISTKLFIDKHLHQISCFLVSWPSGLSFGRALRDVGRKALFPKWSIPCSFEPKPLTVTLWTNTCSHSCKHLARQFLFSPFNTSVLWLWEVGPMEKCCSKGESRSVAFGDVSVRVFVSWFPLMPSKYLYHSSVMTWHWGACVDSFVGNEQSVFKDALFVGDLKLRTLQSWPQSGLWSQQLY